GHDDAEIGLVPGHREALELLGTARSALAQDLLQFLDALLPPTRRQVRQTATVHPVEEVEEVPALFGHEGRRRLCRGFMRHVRSARSDLMPMRVSHSALHSRAGPTETASKPGRCDGSIGATCAGPARCGRST